MIDLAHVRGLVLDLDDTLYPELDFVRSGFRAVAESHAHLLGEPVAGFELLWRMFNEGDTSRVFNAALAARGLKVDQIEINAMVRTYRAHAPQITLHDDADRLLTRWKGRVLLGVLSDGPLEMQQQKIDALRLNERVYAVELTDLYGRDFWKPHPRAFEAIARRLGCPHGELAYVGDNAEKDFIAPNRLGWTTVQIRRVDGVYRNRTPPPSGAAMHEISTLDEL